jgi:hypothetical protein
VERFAGLADGAEGDGRHDRHLNIEMVFRLGCDARFLVDGNAAIWSAMIPAVR